LCGAPFVYRVAEESGICVGPSCIVSGKIVWATRQPDFVIMMDHGHKFYDGTRSTVEFKHVLSGGGTTAMKDKFAGNSDEEAITNINQAAGEPFEGFFRPESINDNIETEARIFHEALHKYTKELDGGLLVRGLLNRFFPLPPINGSLLISYYIRACVLESDAGRCSRLTNRDWTQYQSIPSYEDATK
jgi:hypothetical protein